ncbi:MAG TPA: YggT family protein [Methylomirabilota bacterium]|nr:YggT family protein [Methylomirabilota bacterium]
MFLVSNMLLALARLLDLVLTAYFFIIIARAIVSWVSPDPFNPIVRFLYRSTEPVLRPIRRRLPMMAAGIDFSPMIVILGIYFLKWFLVESLSDFALRLR